MFGIGFTEILILFLVAIIFIRPEDIPSFFRKLGKLFAEAKSAYNEVVAVKDEFIRELESSGEETTRAQETKTAEKTMNERITDSTDSKRVEEGKGPPVPTDETSDSTPKSEEERNEPS